MGNIVKVPEHSRAVKVDLDYDLNDRDKQISILNWNIAYLIYTYAFEELQEYNGFLTEV